MGEADSEDVGALLEQAAGLDEHAGGQDHQLGVSLDVAARALLVVLDQSSWVDVPQAENVFQAASEISRRLKLLARRLGIVIVVVVQVNRAGSASHADGKPIELHHLRDSGRWEQDSDGVLIIQDVDDSTDPASLHIEVKKYRHGPRDMAATLRATLRYGLIEDDPAAVAPPCPFVFVGHGASEARKSSRGFSSARLRSGARRVAQISPS